MSWVGGGLAGLISEGTKTKDRHWLVHPCIWFKSWSRLTMTLLPQLEAASPGIFLHGSALCQKFISMSSSTSWAGSCGFNVISSVTQPSLCGESVIWLNSNREEVVFPFCSGQLSFMHTWIHSEVSGARQHGSMKPNFQVNWIQTLQKQRAKAKTLFRNDYCNHRNRLMFTASHKRGK